MSSNENDDPAQIGMRIRGANGQTANLFVVEVYGGTDKFVIDSDGDVTVAGNFTLTGSLTYTGEMAITGDTAATITLKITGASGQSADLLVVEDNNGTDYFKVGATGNATLTGNLTQTGNQIVTGNVDITGEFFAKGAMPPGDYVVMLDGATYKAFSCRTGDLLSSSATYATVYAAALAALTSGNGVIIDMTDGMGSGPTVNRYSGGVLHAPEFEVRGAPVFKPTTMISLFDDGVGVGKWIASTPAYASDDSTNTRWGKKGIAIQCAAAPTLLTALTGDWGTSGSGTLDIQPDGGLVIRGHTPTTALFNQLEIKIYSSTANYATISRGYPSSLLGSWFEFRANRLDFSITGTVDWSKIYRIRIDAYAASGQTTTVTVDYIAWHHGRNRKPIVVLGVDDSVGNAITVLKSAMDKYGWKGYVCETATSMGTQAEIDAVSKCARDGWDILYHGYDHVGWGNMTENELATDIVRWKRWMTKHRIPLGKWMMCAPPGGSISVDNATVLQKHFHFCRTATNAGREFYPFSSGGFGDGIICASTFDAVSLATAQAAMDTHALTNRVAILYWHGLPVGEWSETNMATFINYIASKGIEVLSLSELLDRAGSYPGLNELRENSGTSTGTGAQQTIPHGLSATPNRVLLSESTTGGALAYQSALADATNIYVTAVNTKTWQWEAKVV